MPFKPGKGPQQLKAKYKLHVDKMTGQQAQVAMAKILSIGTTGAKYLAPVEYGTLMNSAYRRIEQTPTGIRGVAGFAVGYAVYLHQRTDWKPRPVGMKAGPAWNPNAKPRFLIRGFTDPDQVALINKALGDTYK